ncbi:unnamed protein product [Pseudo-nitzschia multistriata]|uniref:Uncharacterized protein n=1 Tax=Pseudo-nitzschia multistriata TaxID=183589 RepID=A0A448ZE96_9STRA|nr:unnamed protein product [Pseudo-nitzschia multistriata]
MCKVVDTKGKNDEPKQPEWPKNVMVFKPTDKVDDIKKRIKPTEDPSKTFELNGETKLTYVSDHHFSTKRYALLFAPGEYKDCQFEVGYYVQMAGLGKTAKGEGAVVFTGEKSGPFVPALNKDMPVTEGGSIDYPGSGLCLDTFWRSAENFSAENVQWAVSQAAPLRRTHVLNKVEFGDGGAYSSGGFFANADVEGECTYVANQQWFTRGVELGGNVAGGAWSTVFAGCTGNVPEASTSPLPKDKPLVTVESTPKVRVEKPMIVLNENGDYELHVPRATADPTLTVGAHLDGSNTEVRCFSNVKVGKPILHFDEDGNYAEIPDDEYNVLTDADKKLTLELQEALDEGKDLVLCPGIYFLTQPLVVKNPGQVVLGLGLASLIAPQDGSPCIRVQANTPGVRIASLVLEASKQDDSSVGSEYMNSDKVMSLIDFGEPDKTGTSDPGDPTNPGLLSDIFTRVGGSNLDRSVKTDVMVRIFSGNVVGDNLWLWRADHVRLRPGEEPNDPSINPRYHQVRIFEGGKRVDECMVKNALQVSGDNVTIYGLFAEHTVEDQVVWKGEHGHVCFFQCELPYDVDTDFNHTGYHVHQDVGVHTAKGLGVYSNFTQFSVVAAKGLSFPSLDLISIENPFTVFLNGKGGIKNVLHEGEEKIGDEVSKLNKLARGWIGTEQL